MNFEKILKILEYDKILLNVSKYCMSQGGAKQILETLPCTNCEKVNKLLLLTEEADKLLYKHALSPELNHEPIDEILSKMHLTTTLSMGELLYVARIFKISRNLKTMIEETPDDSIVLLKDMAFELGTDIRFEEDIARSIISENEMADNASFELREIRQAISAKNNNIRNTLNRYISNSSTSKYLQENIVTIRNGRYVIPVKSECKGQIGGLVHDQSSSGQTLFMEPFDVVQMNNELTTLKLDEVREIERILHEFSVRVSSESDILAHNNEIIINIDSIFAKAKYCHFNKCNKPILENNGNFNIIKGRHPLIDKDKVVPIDINLINNEKVLLITGPNTGGKTVSLKLIGLFSLITMSGIFPPCEYGSVINIYDKIFVDIGDMQSIENDLSTFSSHISNIVEITDNLTPNSLVLLDELGGGTDPSEGGALAVAVLEEILRIGANAVITTHYQELKEFAIRDKRIKCAAMDFNPSTYAPTYKIIMNSTGGSKALQIAKRLGLNARILDDAIKAMKPQIVEFNKVIDAAERAKSEAYAILDQAKTEKNLASSELIEIQKERAEIVELKNQLNEKLKRESAKLMRDYEEEADEAIKEIKSLIKKADERALFEAREIKSKMLKNLDVELDAPVTMRNIYDNTPLKLGDAVYVPKLDKNGIIAKLDDKKNKAIVKLGGISTTLQYDEIRKIVNHVERKIMENSVVHKFTDVSESIVPLELNVRGQTVNEALYNIDTYINQCLSEGYKEVRIVHGKGTGALRKAVGEHLKQYACIEKFRLGKYGEGDDGVTIVRFK